MVLQLSRCTLATDSNAKSGDGRPLWRAFCGEQNQRNSSNLVLNMGLFDLTHRNVVTQLTPCSLSDVG